MTCAGTMVPRFGDTMNGKFTGIAFLVGNYSRKNFFRIPFTPFRIRQFFTLTSFRMGFQIGLVTRVVTELAFSRKTILGAGALRKRIGR